MISIARSKIETYHLDKHYGTSDFEINSLEQIIH